MKQLIVELPYDLSEEVGVQLAGWLTDLARRAADTASFLDHDPASQAEALRRIRAGIDDVEAGRFSGSPEAKQRLTGLPHRDPPA